MIEFANQVAINELEATIKKQNQILLHIKAELEAIKQYNPFNLVLISGSIENISNIVDDHFASVPTIGEWDGGCVGCCKVVDVAAKLQKELDEYKETIRLERIDRQSERTVLNRKYHEDLREKDNTIEELKDGNIEDLNELYAIDKKEIDRLKHVISARESSIDECEKIGRHNVNVLKEIINGLEAELSARKEDSAALEKVVEIVRDNKIYPYGAINELADLLVDYLDAPEGPPETPIDESDVLKKIRALVDDWSVNKKGGKQSFFILSEIDDMLKSTQHIDETQDIIVTFAFLELP